jgi:hypothetical protein
LKGTRLTELNVSLSQVLDCRDVSRLGLSRDDLLSAGDFEAGQRLAAAARELDSEAIIVPTATNFDGYSLVVFPDQLLSGSRVTVTKEEDPDLYIS